MFRADTGTHIVAVTIGALFCLGYGIVEHRKAESLRAELAALKSAQPAAVTTHAEPVPEPASSRVQPIAPPVVQPVVVERTPAQPALPDGNATPIFVSPGPTGERPPEATDEEKDKRRKEWLADFDRKMDQEFARLESREKTTQDEDDMKMIQRIKGSLESLDALWLKADAGEIDENSQEFQMQMHQLMGQIISLSRTDRNQRLSKLAHTYGLVDETQIVPFIQGIDTVYAETHLDWAALFNRAP